MTDMSLFARLWARLIGASPSSDVVNDDSLDNGPDVGSDAGLYPDMGRELADDMDPDSVSGRGSDPVPRLKEMLAYLQWHDDPLLYAGAEFALRRKYALTSRHHWPIEQQKLAQEIAALGQCPGLEQVFLFHGDGRLRQAALDQLDGALDLSVVVYGLISRLNDWAGPVRQAAQKAMARCLRDTPDTVLVPALWVLVQRARYWRRVPEAYERILDVVFARPGVLDLMMAQLRDTQGAGAVQVLRSLGARPAIDGYLPDLAQNAAKPIVRAVALRQLGTGRVDWPTGGMVRDWIDKPMGLYRMRPEMAGRAVTLGVDLADLIAQGLGDRAAQVRATALDLAIHARKDPVIAAHLEDYIAQTAQDRSTRVARRRDYLSSVVG